MEATGRCLEGPSGERVLTGEAIELLALGRELKTIAFRYATADKHSDGEREELEKILGIAERITYERRVLRVVESA